MTLKMDGVMGQEDRYCHLSNQVCYSSNKNLIHKSQSICHRERHDLYIPELYILEGETCFVF